MSVFPKETVKNIGESLGITNLKDDAASALAQDVEYRVHELIQEATKFMRHSKRTRLTVDDINSALRAKNVEPLYGYACSGPPKFRKANVASTDVYFTQDDELDFDTILSKPLPKIPLDVSFTAHWLAIEGVQPAIPQNPTPGDAKADLLSKRSKSHGGTSGLSDQVDVKPLVKHVLSKELQMYFERITEAVLSEDERLRSQAFESLRMDPGLHQLLPYFVQHIHKKVTQNHKDLDVLDAMLSMAHSLLNNQHLFVEPYLHQLIPPIITCLVGRTISEDPFQDHWSVRRRAASLIANICRHYGKAYHTLQPRIAKTLVRALLDPSRPLTTQYGAIIGLDALGTEVTRVLVLPHIKFFTTHCLQNALENGNPQRVQEAEKCKEALLDVLERVAKDGTHMETSDQASEQEKKRLVDDIGQLLGDLFLQKRPNITSNELQSILESTSATQQD
ncbi:transcription initiation factor TFIID subunit 6 [Lichtheimia hyalospora FSU 10163]|nr:transcription initiation factor TFIID subunit 6 [Lichtheimia hyalospora FSU 10163]